MASKKVTKVKSTKTKSPKTKLAKNPLTEPMLTTPNPSVMPNPISPKLSAKILPATLILVAVALLVYKLGPYFVPALVGNTPVTRFELWTRLEKSYGDQTLDDLVNEKILDNAISKSGIKPDQAKIDDQIKSLEVQFESLGGLDAALEQRGMDRSELLRQVTTQLTVEEILKDKVAPTDDEVMAAFKEGETTTYKDQKYDDVQAEIKEQLTQSKLVEAFRDWFEMIKAEYKVKNFGL